MSEIVKHFNRTDSLGMTLLTPWVISKKKKTIYLHIAKTGGSSVTELLRRNGLDDGVLTNKKGDPKGKLEYFKEVVAEWDRYYKFTFIRNKYAMLVSLFYYDGKPGGTFKKFISDIIGPNKDIYDYWIDQYFLTVIDNRPIFDFIGRNESFEADFKKICAHIGIKYVPIRVNITKYDRSKHFSEHYDEETRRLVHNKFRDEIDFYKFTLKG